MVMPKRIYASLIPGNFGGIRAATALRPVLAEIGSMCSQAQVTIPSIRDAVSEAGEPNERVGKSLTKALDVLEWYADAYKSKKGKSGLPE